jgi:L-threonylcarbamoyladenylate synthase
VTAGLDTVALRCPAHPAMQALLAATGRPLAAPSANASGRISPTTRRACAASLGGRIPLILDGGADRARAWNRRSSRCGRRRVELLRPGRSRGGSSAPALSAATGSAIEAPGQLASHYAPAKPLRLDAEEARRPPGEWLIGFGPVAGDGEALAQLLSLGGMTARQ